MLTVPELLTRAEDCERLADNAKFVPQRSLLLELAAKWRRLAGCTDGEGGAAEPPPVSPAAPLTS